MITGTFGTVPWTWYDYGLKLVFGGGEFPEGNISSSLPIDSADIRHIVFTEPVKAHPNSSSLFSSFAFGVTIENIEKLDTSNVTNMYSMFLSSSRLKSLDLTNWDTSKVTDMYGMFASANSLTSLDLANWDTSKVKSMYNMFSNANQLNTLKVGTATVFENEANLSEKNKDPYTGAWRLQARWNPSIYQ